MAEVSLSGLSCLLATFAPSIRTVAFVVSEVSSGKVFFDISNGELKWDTSLKRVKY